MKAKSMLLAVITIISSLIFLLFFTASWEMVGWLGLWMYVGIMAAIFGAWIVLTTKLGIERETLKTIDFAMIAMFVALAIVIDFGSMFVPGLSFLWYLLPEIAAPIMFYFPLGIAIAAALKLSPKPGSAFTLIFVYGLISQVFFFNPLWLARSIIAALGIEAYYLSSKRGTLTSLVLMGLMFGILYSVSGIIFQIYTWGFWQPLFVTLPEAIMAGIMMAAGSLLGYALGDRAKSVMY
jgi:hypothetical protein